MRLNILKKLYIFVLFLIAVRLFYWQVIRFDDLSAMADQQHLVSFSLDAPRGLILSSDGAVLASNKPVYLLYGLPKVVKDKEGLSLKLAKILVGKNEAPGAEADTQAILDLKDKLLAKLSEDLYWVILDKNLDISVKQSIEKLDVGGIGFESESSRYYPEASSGAHILGFVGSDTLGQETGYFGVEGFYNGELRGIGGVLTEEKDAQGFPILMGKFIKKEPQKGHDLTLNVDRTVQYIVEKKLKAGMQKYGAKSGSVIVMDPQSGAVLAMASYPNYDPNNFFDFPKNNFRNPIVADSYEPGSTFKVLVMAAALNENLVKPDTKCDICAGPVQISGYAIRTWNNKYTKDTDMASVIVHSDNTGMVFTARKLGVDKMYNYIQNYGFGTITQIDLQDETSPDIRAKKDWREIDLATSSFGQGIAVTPIQMVRAVAVIANGGNLVQPQIVQSIQANSKITKIKPKVIRQVVSKEAAQTVTQMMVSAVEQGEAKTFAPKGFKIAGKTGTAQIPVAGHYDANKTIASFVGFAPADDPKFVMLVIYQEPSSSIFGAETAAPTFFDIAKELLMYYNIAPN